ncbi:3-methyladenine DNA glycosylase AlkC [Williamsia muralis]|uniref:3-methyladenine DNA glycosylase AlkC n=1 Tax=Williamsia marianensis TaxID=85044 RepID=A0A495JZG9_WILMA|nr:DNA alkylation repair protein [Williamsia muralis]RKR93589.1 3-methyladenine DNA glycosylase AlkC [Williamsia muralis]
MPFADELLGASAVEGLTTCLMLAGYDTARTSATVTEFDGMALKNRSDLVRDALIGDLPEPFTEFVSAVNKLIDQPGCTGWMVWPITEAVALRATAQRTTGAFDIGLALLAELTPRLTSEFALRTMLLADLDRTLAAARAWAESPDHHVRRLASEGTRHYLPWARRIPELLRHPEATLPIVDALYRDPSEYVRRSVANHVNDLSRHHPDLVVSTAARWQSAPDANTGKLVRHALRTLVKKGDPGALALLGFDAPTGLDLTELIVDPTVDTGDKLTFAVTLAHSGESPVNVVVDYSIGFRKANGAITHKVFKLATKTMRPGEHLSLSKSHSFAPITTRRYHPGRHELAVQVNGRRMGVAEFDLLGAVDPTVLR